MMLESRIVIAVAVAMSLSQCVAVSGNAQTVTPVSVASGNEAAGGMMLNQFRASNGRSALRPHAALERAALAHARDMGNNNFMSHVGSDGSSLRDRIRRQGYRACAYAENVAKGQGSMERAMAFWQKSPGHRTNMLNARYTHYGLARGPGNSWVMVLGQPGC